MFNLYKLERFLILKAFQDLKANVRHLVALKNIISSLDGIRNWIVSIPFKLNITIFSTNTNTSLMTVLTDYCNKGRDSIKKEY